MARLQQMVAEREREVEHLKEQLAASEARDGSLFDLKRDSIKTIIDTIVGTITEGRATGIAQEILSRFKKKKTPAG